MVGNNNLLNPIDQTVEIYQAGYQSVTEYLYSVYEVPKVRGIVQPETSSYNRYYNLTIIEQVNIYCYKE